MKHIKTFNQNATDDWPKQFPDNWEDIKKELDEKSYYLDYSEITYAFVDLIDEEVIEVEDIKKLYRYEKSYKITNGVKRDAYYGVIIYDIKIKVLNRERVDEYVSYRDGDGKSLLKEFYGYGILNGRPTKYFTQWHREKDIDDFNLWSKVVWI